MLAVKDAQKCPRLTKFIGNSTKLGVWAREETSDPGEVHRPGAGRKVTACPIQVDLAMSGAGISGCLGVGNCSSRRRVEI
jgi:hypothetical protein